MKKTILKSTGEEIFPTGGTVTVLVADKKGKAFKGSEGKGNRVNVNQYLMCGFLTGNTKPGSKRMDIRPVRKDKLIQSYG